MIGLAQVRTEIADRPKLWPPQVAEPEQIGTGDGVATIFGLQFENFIPNTLTILLGTSPAVGSAVVFTAVNPANYTVGAPDPGPDATAATNAIITFNTAPALGVLVAARYQSVAFSDADLLVYLTNAQALFSDDRTILKCVHRDVIPAIVADQRRIDIITDGTYKRDPGPYVAAQLKLYDALGKDLTGTPTPGSATPALFDGAACAPRYAPER